ncbi:hypothetical protein DAPPUDRAFT_326832 [Daphnia pulex]|uniref:Uncharacterized protein n=1 Tax=Daphnia pulex TaxID=6669 RepID=E9H8X0_DAPPU|nr:hypothetical protein DAPPUDRAFT_326832 [Daphnia pulex]|eukprot:EFX71797.1 hypothetical protein DAPPUDRAFT_326832 [Daphnia pulex]
MVEWNRNRSEKKRLLIVFITLLGNITNIWTLKIIDNWLVNLVLLDTTYSESAADSAPLWILWSQFYGCNFLPGQTAVEFITEIEHVVSRLRAINGIVLLDDQIIAKVTMSLRPILKFIFKAAWGSMAAADKTLRNLTTRLVQMEKEVKESEKEKESKALLSKRVNLTTYFNPEMTKTRM